MENQVSGKPTILASSFKSNGFGSLRLLFREHLNQASIVIGVLHVHIQKNGIIVMKKRKHFSPPFLVSHRNVFSNMGSNSTQGAAEPNIEASIKDKVPSWTDKKRFTPNITAV